MAYISVFKWFYSLNKLIKSHFFSRLLLSVSLFGSISFTAEATEAKNSTDKKHGELTHDQLKIGERLFYGLINTGENKVSCASCHYFFQTDTVNWYPSAYEIANAVHNTTAEQFKNSLLAPTGKVSSVAHANIELSEEQLSFVRGYLLELHKKGMTPTKPVINKLLIFIGLILLIIIAIVDLAFSKKIPYKVVHFVIILGAGLLITKTLAHEAIAIGRSQNYEPDQPIKFSHVVHAQQNKIDCKYCHTTVEQSKTASIPSANVCMNCHVIVREGSRSGKFEINKIVNAVENNKPVEWIKVHNLPDHVFFSHAQHVGVGKVACQTCHGEVEKMDRVKQVSDLSMGWCINCHRDTKVQFADNAFYSKYEDLHKKIKEGVIDSVTVAQIGGLDCMKCHY